LKAETMDLIKEFEAHAQECRRMARSTRDHESRATWSRMAERWVRLADSHKATARRTVETRHRTERPIYRRARESQVA
jgi:hypothetical protein